jgi:hypothetical protein
MRFYWSLHEPMRRAQFGAGAPGSGSLFVLNFKLTSSPEDRNGPAAENNAP